MWRHQVWSFFHLPRNRRVSRSVGSAMGNCCGTPQKEEQRPATPTPAPPRKDETPSQPTRPPETVPDPALQSTLKAIKSLGKGGTGDTWLYIDRATGEEVAVKLMKRPLPRVIQPNIEREIRVGSLKLFLFLHGLRLEL